MAAGVTFKAKRKAGAFVTTELGAGEFGIDTTNDDWYFSTDGVDVISIDTSKLDGIEAGADVTDATNVAAAGAVMSETKSIVIESPTASEDITLWHTDVAITITRMAMVLTGSSTPSVTFNLVHGTDRSATGSNLWTSDEVITTTTTDDTGAAFNDATVVADSWLWIETQAQSGTVDSLAITIEYTVD